MWNARVERTDKKNGELNIVVVYSNDLDESFSETYTTRADQNPDWLANNIKGRLLQLAELDTFETDLKGSIINDSVVTLDLDGKITTTPKPIVAAIEEI